MEASGNVSDSVQLLAQNEPDVFNRAANLLIKIISNILKDPGNEKYRRMRIGNPRLSEKLLPVDGAFQCLFDMGFQEDGEFLTLPADASLDRLKQTHQDLEKTKENLHQKSLPQRRKTKAEPKPTKDSAPKPSLPIGIQLFQSEAQFFRKLKDALDRVMVYEFPALQQKAQQVIPVLQLRQRAQKKLDSLKPSKDNPDIRDMLLLELLAWFKKDFFSWVDKPKCERCQSPTTNAGMATPTDEEMRFGAQRVENYRCGSCSAHTRFPRYNDPGKLLETRRGRCGEWANCFTLCCRALDFEARYVLDWTDHVWTEVFSESQSRWLHCDPCENQCDKPLVYETGWNKKLSYIFAFSKDDIQDVVWRYSCSHTEVLSRRNECREAWLMQTITKLRSQKQEALNLQRKQVLQDRLLKELVEFLSVKSAGADENVGRSSGSASWRVMRGEIGNPSKSTSIKPTASEMASQVLHLRYCCATDQYTRVSDSNTQMEGWQSLTHSVTNVFRKEEQDWDMVYLARTEGSQQATVSWHFDFSGTSVVVDRVEVTAQSRVYENGRINWRVCAGDQCAILPADGRHTVLDSLQGSEVVDLSATLSQGQGQVAWQHTQLFRQGLRDYGIHPLEIRITLKKREL